MDSGGHSVDFGTRLRALLACLFCIFVGAVAEAQDSAAPGNGQQAVAEADSVFRRDEVDISVDRAVEWLRSKQREDGAILDRSHDTTMTALSIMAEDDTVCCLQSISTEFFDLVKVRRLELVDMNLTD